MTGPEAITLQEVAEELSRVTGRSITYNAETLEEACESRASYGAPDFEVEGWVTSYAAIAAGEMDVVSDTTSKLAGHSPVTRQSRSPTSCADTRSATGTCSVLECGRRPSLPVVSWPLALIAELPRARCDHSEPSR